MEGDHRLAIHVRCPVISIHTLRMEGDGYTVEDFVAVIDISIHTLRMEGDLGRVCSLGHVLGISIHTLRMEGDKYKDLGSALQGLFQSTPSAWRVTTFVAAVYVYDDISIHTLRMEGDE